MIQNEEEVEIIEEGMLKIYINFQSKIFKFFVIFSFNANYKIFCDVL